MRIPAIKELVDRYSLAELQKAEEALLNEDTPEIDLGPDEPGDQLTHVIGAISIHKDIADGEDPKKALRAFTQRVRNSIN